MTFGPVSSGVSRGVRASYGYDVLNRLVQKEYSSDPNGTPTVTYTYDCRRGEVPPEKRFDIAIPLRKKARLVMRERTSKPRYYSCPLDAEHGWHALAYVERNPVRAGLTPLAEEYRWSSVQARLGLIATPEWLNVAEWQRHYDAERWRHVLAAGAADQAWRQRIQEATLAGKPVGSQEFVRRLADDFDRNMEIRPPGRPSASRLSVA